MQVFFIFFVKIKLTKLLIAIHWKVLYENLIRNTIGESTLDKLHNQVYFFSSLGLNLRLNIDCSPSCLVWQGLKILEKNLLKGDVRNFYFAGGGWH